MYITSYANTDLFIHCSEWCASHMNDSNLYKYSKEVCTVSFSFEYRCVVVFNKSVNVVWLCILMFIKKIYCIDNMKGLQSISFY